MLRIPLRRGRFFTTAERAGASSGIILNEAAEMFSRRMAQRRLNMLLLGLSGLLGLTIAGAGMYGLMAFVVAEKTREIGVRMALGASRRHAARSSPQRPRFGTLPACATTERRELAGRRRLTEHQADITIRDC